MQLEWTEVHKELVSCMARVAVPIQIVNRPDLFRGRLEFESRRRYSWQRVDLEKTHARGIDVAGVSEEIKLLYNALKAHQLLPGGNGNCKSVVVRCRRLGRSIFLQFEPDHQ